MKTINKQEAFLIKIYRDLTDDGKAEAILMARKFTTDNKKEEPQEGQETQ